MSILLDSQEDDEAEKNVSTESFPLSSGEQTPQAITIPQKTMLAGVPQNEYLAVK